MIILITGALLSALFIPYFSYYLYMKKKLATPWNLNIDQTYQPTVSLIIAVYNEASVIEKRLTNLQQLDYPIDKLQVIIVDSASTDNTLAKCQNFFKKDQLRFRKIMLLSEKKRMGKSHALNAALEHADGEIIATSDADSFWEPDVLKKALPYFNDPSVGAITGREELTNAEKTVYTQSEGEYRKLYYNLRLGESKIDSTLIFQGELSLYRKSVLDKFEDKPGYSDDVGTVIKIISKGYRCIFVPEAVFHDTAAFSLRGRIVLKSRRAEHLISGILLAQKLKLKGKFPLSSTNIVFNLFMHIISPWILLVTLIVMLLFIQTFFYLVPLLIAALILRKSRVLIVSYLTSNLALIFGVLNHFFGRKKTTWSKIDEMRTP